MGVQGDLINISAPVEREFNQRLRLAVVERGLPSKAEAIRQALEEWLEREPCPQCDGPTMADPRRPGVRYCPACDEAVGFRPSAGIAMAQDDAEIMS